MKNGVWIKQEDGTRIPGVIGKDGTASPVSETKKTAKAKPATKEK